MRALQIKKKPTIKIASKISPKAKSNRLIKVMENMIDYLSDEHYVEKTGMSCGIELAYELGNIYSYISKGRIKLSKKDSGLVISYLMLHSLLSTDFDFAIDEQETTKNVAFTLASLSNRCDAGLIKILNSFVRLSKNSKKSASIKNPNSGNMIWVYIFDTKSIVNEFNRLNKLIYNGR
jgi:hypothetical protein